MYFVKADYTTLDVRRKWYTFLTCQGNVHNIDKKCIGITVLRFYFPLPHRNNIYNFT